VLERFSQSRLSHGVMAEEDIIETGLPMTSIRYRWIGVVLYRCVVRRWAWSSRVHYHTATPCDVFVIYSL